MKRRKNPEAYAEFLNEELELKPIDQGWWDGYHDRGDRNPFEGGSDDYAEYDRGYAQGSGDRS